MLTGALPFSSKAIGHLIAQQKQGIYKVPKGLKISKQVAHLVHNMILLKEKDRINFKDFFDHPYFHDEMVETSMRKMLESSQKTLDIREPKLLDDI
jgi:hypothetical protein